MMSFRRAVDATLIAQLVGRMVRTPLARRIEANEALNRVMLFLPHYNKAGLQNVVKYLTADDGVMPPTDVEDASEVATLNPLPTSAKLLKRVEQLPSYTIPRRRSVHDVHRLMRLARVLEDASLKDGARDLAQVALINVLRQEVSDRQTDEAFQQALSEEGRIAVDVVTEYHKQARDENTVYLAASSENVRDLTEAVGRRMREGLHLAFVRTRVESDGLSVQDARLELAALYRDGAAHEKLMRRARDLTTEWFAALAPTFSSLSPALQARLNEIRSSSAQAEQQSMMMPPTMTVTTVAAMKELALGGHLYVDADGHYPGKLTTWEVAVIREEEKRAGAMGWLRNLPRKPWSLTVPYQSHGNVAPLYPDLLFFRKASGGIVVDLLDPHLTALDDAAPKAQGLARYADEHGALFGRIELIQVKDKQVQRLDLTKPAVREKVKAVITNDHLRHLYDLLGES
jgi:type III restriction enzyme